MRRFTGRLDATDVGSTPPVPVAALYVDPLADPFRVADFLAFRSGALPVSVNLYAAPATGSRPWIVVDQSAYPTELRVFLRGRPGVDEVVHRIAGTGSPAAIRAALDTVVQSFARLVGDATPTP